MMVLFETTRGAVQYKADLEQLLTVELRKQQPEVSSVTISSDGEFAIYHVEDRYQVRKLSQSAKDFLSNGDIERLNKKSLFL